MSDILSLDVLLLILEHVHRSDLPALCRLNKTVYPHCRYVLYRDVEVSGANVMQACTTLYQTPALTEKVHRFSLCEGRSIGLVQIIFGLLCDLLLMMPNLRILSLHIGPHGSWILPPPNTVPFRLISFSTGFSYHGDLVQFLHGQTELRTLSLPAWPEGYRAWFTSKSLPNLTKIFAPLSLIQELIPDRPINDISMKSILSMSDSTDLDCFAKSAAQRGVTRLKIEQSVLESVGAEHLSTIIPHLVDLTVVCSTSPFERKEDVEVMSEWISEILSVFLCLEYLTVYLDPHTGVWRIDTTKIDFRPLITPTVERAPRFRQLSIKFIGASHQDYAWVMDEKEWVYLGTPLALINS